jgi:hypothetical protein
MSAMAAPRSSATIAMIAHNIQKERRSSVTLKKVPEGAA